VELIDSFELARRLGRHPRSVERWRYLRKGPPYIRHDGRVWYDWDAVKDDYLAPLTVRAARPTASRPKGRRHESRVGL